MPNIITLVHNAFKTNRKRRNDGVAYLTYHAMYGVLGVFKSYNLISLLVAVGVGNIVYLVLCYMLGIEEVRMVVGKVR